MKTSGTTVAVIAVLALSMAVGTWAGVVIAKGSGKEAVPRRVQDACLLHQGRMAVAAERCIQDRRDGLWR